MAQQKWSVSWDDGDGVVEETFAGKLSLDPMWAMILDADRSPSLPVFAVPTARVIEVRATT